MIPIKLTLANFMPYRDVQSLDFSGIHTASICGANGSGKSSIVDAMTWALWGETRAKHDDDLIHQGQNECEVDFEFAVAGQTYRVVRKHARPKRRTGSGQTWLHLFTVTVGRYRTESGYRTIDGDTMTQTQQKLSQILHMDYDTFTNSAYLRQGHADEFTTANPAKRKMVLSSILQLEYYDELADRAREVAKQRETEKEQTALSLVEINADLAQVPVCEAELKEALSELAGSEEAIGRHEATLTGLRQQKEALEGKRAQLLQIERTMAERQRTLAQIEAQIRQQQARIKEHEAVLSQREQIEAGYARFSEARDRNEAMNKNLALINRFMNKKHALEQEITRKSQELVRQHTQAQMRVSESTKTAGGLSRLKDDYRQVQRLLEDIATRDAALQQKKQAAQKLMTEVQTMQSDRTRLEREMQEIAEKLHLLRTQKGARCPLCGCELGEDGITHIESEFSKQRQAKAEAVRINQSEAQVKQGELKALTEETQLAERAIAQEKAKGLAQVGGLETEIDRAEEAGTLLAGEQARVKEIEEHLTARDFAAAEQEQVRQIDEAVLKLDYDAQKHDAVRQLYEDSKKYEVPKQKLDEAERLIAREREDMEKSSALALELRAGLSTDAQKRLELTSEVTSLPQVAGDLARAEADLKEMAVRQRQAQEKLGGIKARLAYLQGLAVKKREREEQYDRAAKEESVYKDLSEAFGKKGVQALIIETALPEIENEANRLLARMTDSRMNVKFESQRATQKGDVIETLDIKIADELGTRNYELFSGGEAFRINFSIRIALSRLLARRAGAPLPTLIIDEGFGTQDAAGIEKLREAITTIQDDFEKILVITHIEELRDAFPARIDVVKTPDGSVISLG